MEEALKVALCQEESLEEDIVDQAKESSLLVVPPTPQVSAIPSRVPAPVKDSLEDVIVQLTNRMDKLQLDLLQACERMPPRINDGQGGQLRNYVPPDLSRITCYGCQ